MQRVLIVEPDAELRAALARSVRAAGWAAEAVASAPEALRCIEEVAVDAALVEVRDFDDADALARMRRRAPRLALVAMGANPSFELAVNAMKQGACDFLRKPFGVGALEGTLFAALSGRARSRAAGVQLWTRDPGMERLLHETKVAAATDATVQIVGESGTGKDLFARFVHLHSLRRAGPFVSVNCAALPEGLAESELFGHERGAFTGAVEDRPGQIAAANGGTLLLDEVSELAPSLQPKLLRALQEREVQPVGALTPRAVDVRVLVTTQRDLAGEVVAGRFREDLYYRLDVIVLRIPPLRERPADIPFLAERFLEQLARAQGVEPPRLGERTLVRLVAYRFPGNVRELENLMRRAVVLFPGREIEADRLFERRPGRGSWATPSPVLNLRELERQTIIRSLTEFGGNRTLAARALGISVRTLRNKIHLYQLA